MTLPCWRAGEAGVPDGTGGRLPPLPEWLLAKRDSMEIVHECMTTVFVHVEKDGDGRLTFYLDVPPESPTVRGYATILSEGWPGPRSMR